MIDDIDKLEALAKAVVRNAWWTPAGLRNAIGNLMGERCIEFLSAASPADVLALIAEVRRLRALLDNRPALNAGLTEAYHTWTAGVYASDAAAIRGETKQ